MIFPEPRCSFCLWPSTPLLRIRIEQTIFCLRFWKRLFHIVQPPQVANLQGLDQAVREVANCRAGVWCELAAAYLVNRGNEKRNQVAHGLGSKFRRIDWQRRRPIAPAAKAWAARSSFAFAGL